MSEATTRLIKELGESLTDGVEGLTWTTRSNEYFQSNKVVTEERYFLTHVMRAMSSIDIVAYVIKKLEEKGNGGDVLVYDDPATGDCTIIHRYEQ